MLPPHHRRGEATSIDQKVVLYFPYNPSASTCLVLFKQSNNTKVSGMYEYIRTAKITLYLIPESLNTFNRTQYES